MTKHETIPMSQNPDGSYSKSHPVGEIAIGMGSTFWAVKHPFKAFLRFFGLFSAAMGGIALVAGIAYIVSGSSDRPQASLNPVDLGRTGAYLLKPPVQNAADTVNSVMDAPSSAITSVEQLYRPEE